MIGENVIKRRMFHFQPFRSSDESVTKLFKFDYLLLDAISPHRDFFIVVCHIVLKYISWQFVFEGRQIVFELEVYMI